MSDIKQKILSRFSGPTLSVLATITEDGKPWCRYVVPIVDDTFTFWMATRLSTRKPGQIRKNPEVHLTAGCTNPAAGEPFLQIQGKAEILTDMESKKKIWGDHLKSIFSGIDDPNLAVVKVKAYRIEYQPMGPVPPEVWEA